MMTDPCCPCALAAEQEMWNNATSVADLGELTAQWLEGSISWNPNYRSGGGPRGPEDETLPYVPTLAALNRAGFATEFSQPGEVRLYEPIPGWEEHDELDRWQRAVVSGAMDRSNLDGLRELRLRCADYGLKFSAWLGPNPSLDDKVISFSFAGALHAYPTTPEHFRRQLTGWWIRPSRRRVLEMWNYPAGVHEALGRAWYVTVSDPEVGRNDRLWPALERWAGEERK